MTTPHRVSVLLSGSARMPLLIGAALTALLFVAAVFLALAPVVNHHVPSRPAALQSVRLLSGSGPRQSLPTTAGTPVATTSATVPPVSTPFVSPMGAHGQKLEPPIVPMVPMVTTTTAVPADPPVVLSAQICVVTVTGTWEVATFTEGCTAAQSYVAPLGTTATVTSSSEKVTTDAGSLAGK